MYTEKIDYFMIFNYRLKLKFIL